MLAASNVDRKQAHPVWKVTWIGILRDGLAENVTYAAGGEATTFGVPDGGAEVIFVIAGSGKTAAGPSPACPYGPSLSAIAGEHFTFVSAQEFEDTGEPEREMPARLEAVDRQADIAELPPCARQHEAPPPEKTLRPERYRSLGRKQQHPLCPTVGHLCDIPARSHKAKV